MIALIRSELIKLSSTKMWWILFIIAVALTVLSSLPLILVASAGPDSLGADSGAPFPVLTDPDTMRQVWATMGSATIIAVILGVLAYTGEYRHQTITDTFLTEPRRGAVTISKSIVYAITGVVLAVVTCVVAALIIIALLGGKAHAPYDFGYVLQVALGVMLAYALYAVLGVAIGALITSQVAAVIITLVFFLLVEPIIETVWPQVGRWLPGGAASGILNSTDPQGGDLLPIWLAAALLIGYAVVFSVAAAFSTLRRDIT